jgi:hypothetical protein
MQSAFFSLHKLQAARNVIYMQPSKKAISDACISLAPTHSEAFIVPYDAVCWTSVPRSRWAHSSMLPCQICRHSATHTLALLRDFPHSPQPYNDLEFYNI